jgi:hypothetical protein
MTEGKDNDSIPVEPISGHVGGLAKLDDALPNVGT